MVICVKVNDVHVKMIMNLNKEKYKANKLKITLFGKLFVTSTNKSYLFV